MTKKSVFIAFAKEDELTRNLFVGQRVNAKTPFEFIDLSVNEAYLSDWKSKVTTRIRRSDGVIVLLSANSAGAEGQIWEVATAQAEGKPILGVWIQDGFRTKPFLMANETCVVWSWDAIAAFVDAL